MSVAIFNISLGKSMKLRANYAMNASALAS